MTIPSQSLLLVPSPLSDLNVSIASELDTGFSFLFFPSVVGWIMPRRCHVLIPESVNVTLCGKRDFAGMIALRTLKIGNLYWIIHIDPICNYKCPYKERQWEIWLQKKKAMWQLRQDAMLLRDGGRGHGPGNARNAAPEAGKGKGMDFPVEPPEGGWPCRYLKTDFGLQRSRTVREEMCATKFVVMCHQLLHSLFYPSLWLENHFSVNKFKMCFSNPDLGLQIHTNLAWVGSASPSSLLLLSTTVHTLPRVFPNFIPSLVATLYCLPIALLITSKLFTLSLSPSLTWPMPTPPTSSTLLKLSSAPIPC